MPRLSLSDWRAEQFRLTIFTMPGATTSSPEWWESMVGSAPDETTSNPKKGLSLVAGFFGPGKLVLKSEPDRIDWLLVPLDPESDVAVEPEFPNIGLVTEALAVFSEVAEKWLSRNDVPDVARIAFGAVLTHSEPDRRSAYIRLPDYVPVRVDPESSDFLFQINLRIPSRTGINGLHINRLSKWAVASYKVIAFSAAGGDFTPHPVAQAIFALRMELDINTAPEFAGPIQRARLVDVYRELVEFGCQIAAEGVVQR